MRLRLLLFGRDILELTATRHEDLEPEPFGFTAGSTLYLERSEEPMDEEARKHG